MISDYIQEAYAQYGRRSPYAIQKYFWLEAFVKNEISQSVWDKSVLPNPPDGDWRKLTPEMKADTGFYAKQILCGTKENPLGLIWWLWVTNSPEEIRATLQTWQKQPVREWDSNSASAPVKNDTTERFRITREDLKYIPDEKCKAAVEAMI